MFLNKEQFRYKVLQLCALSPGENNNKMAITTELNIRKFDIKVNSKGK
jgi:hypothetical protein